MKFESMSLWMPGLAIALAVLAVLGRLLWRRRARMAEWRQRPDALRLEPIPEMYARIRDQLIDPKTGFRGEYAARIRTKLNLPPPPPTTNAPAAAPAVPQK